MNRLDQGVGVGLFLTSAVALSAVSCQPIDHTVGTARENAVVAEHPNGGAGSPDLWPSNVVRDCSGDVDTVLPSRPYCYGHWAAPDPAFYSLVLVVDRSEAMASPIWEAIADGLAQAMRQHESSADSKVAIVFAGSDTSGSGGDQCAESAYQFLAMSASESAAGIQDAFAASVPTGAARPLLPAVSAAFGLLGTETTQTIADGTEHPRQHVVLLSAGAPNTCPEADELEALEQVVRNARDGADPQRAPISIRVVEIGGEGELATIAQASGQELVSISADDIAPPDLALQVSSLIQGELADLSFGTDRCSFPIYGAQSVELSTGRLVLYMPNGPELVPLLAGPEQCSDSEFGGWYFEPGSPGDTSAYARFCDCSCARLAAAGGHFGVEFACP